MVINHVAMQPFIHKVFKLGCLWQRLLSSPLKRGAGGVFWQTYTPLYPLFLEGNHIRLKFLDVNQAFGDFEQ